MKKYTLIVVTAISLLFGCGIKTPIINSKIKGPNLYIASAVPYCKDGNKMLTVTFESTGCNFHSGDADTYFAISESGNIVTSINKPITCLSTDIEINDLPCNKEYRLDIYRDFNNNGVLEDEVVSKNINFLFEVPLLQECCKTINETTCPKECQTTALNLSTGYNHSSNSVYTAGQTDAYWELISVPNSSGYAAPRPAFTTTPYAPWNAPNTSDGLWISGEPTASWETNNPSIPYVFERCFCYCKDIQGKEPKLDMMVWADDEVELSIVGDVTTPIQTVDGWSGTQVSSLLPELEAGKNYCIRAALKNTGRTAMGLKIEGGLSGGVFSKPSCCSTESKITGFKYHDKDCNGRLDSGDTKMEGWVIQLKDNSGNVINTSTTDVGGYYFFNDVPSGTYQISEIAQTGWNFNTPESGTYTNIVVEANEVLNFNFGNCEDPPSPPNCCPGENMITNGNFNDGNTGFTSEYMFSSGSIVPGQYGVINGAEAITISSTWVVGEHQTCSSSGNFLVVNGENGGGPSPSPLSNSIPDKKTIWEQTIDIKDWRGYKFCFKAKNLNQCGFNIIPKIEVQFSMPFGNITETVNVSSSTCTWHEYEKHLDLYGYGNSLNIKIVLDQTEFGDGNDIAIDDIFLTEIPPIDISYTTFGMSNPSPLSGNNFNITFDATPLPDDCGCFWEVAEIDPQTDEIIPGTKVSNAEPWWSLPTYCNSFNFAGYDGDSNLGSTSNAGLFDITKTYRITRGAFCDCKAWKQTSYDLFEHNNLLLLQDKKSKKEIARFSITSDKE